MVDYKKIVKGVVIATTVGVLALYSPPALGQEAQDQVKNKEDIIQIDYTLEKRVNDSIYKSTHDAYGEIYNGLREFPVMIIYFKLNSEKENMNEKQFKELKGFVDDRIKKMDNYPIFMAETALEYKNTMEPLLIELKETQDKYENNKNVENWEAYDTLRDDIEEKLNNFNQEWDGFSDKISGTLNSTIEILNEKLDEIKKK